MLSLLHIENIAVIENADIEFTNGFQVLTGETGAGKSIIIDAINAVLGERISRDLLRTGTKKAVARAVFVNNTNKAAEYTDSSGRLELSREIYADGKNVCRINGKQVQTSALRELGATIVDIHGQNDSRHLLNPDTHIKYLDSFAHIDGQLSEYRAIYAKLRETDRRIRALVTDANERMRRMDMLVYQIAEIDSANLVLGEDDGLNEKKTVLQNSEKLASAVDDTYSLMCGDEEVSGVCSMLTGAASALQSVADVGGTAFERIYQRIEELRYNAEDIASELRNMREDIPADSAYELNGIEERLDLIYKLKRKYGNTIREILEFAEGAKTDRDEMENSDELRARLAEQSVQLKKQAISAAEKLSEKRHEAAHVLAKRLEQELAYLDMARVRFSVEFDYTGDSEPALNDNGIDELEFFLAANRGESLKPLSKTASGGELSRIMLAFKNVIASGDNVPVLIFDEVDAGISGRAAQRVGEKLWSATADGQKQVLCVTHLSQIAAMADRHFMIEKLEHGDRTATSVAPLDDIGRCHEIARINTGDAITEVSLSAARQQLEISAKYKRGACQSIAEN